MAIDARDLPPLIRADLQRDLLRVDEDSAAKRRLGQYLTPAEIARRMASMIPEAGQAVRACDPGAGSGILSLALVEELLARDTPPTEIDLTLYEVDDRIRGALEANLSEAVAWAAAHGVSLTFQICAGDFVADWPSVADVFDLVIMNPPYGKLSVGRREAVRRSVGVQVPNEYAAFLAAGVRALRPGGTMVAITPRSFANGPYFREFRRDFISRTTWLEICLIESRSTAFADDGVLQENLIYAVSKGTTSKPGATATLSFLSTSPGNSARRVALDSLVDAEDPDLILHLPVRDGDAKVRWMVESLGHSLASLGLAASTGRVVDFRNRDHLRLASSTNTVPLVQAHNCVDGLVVWPRHRDRKFQAMEANALTASLLIPAGWYVLVKRFTSKEERRRVVAATVSPALGPYLAIENHLNYIHQDGSGMSESLAKGVTAYLNSTVIDEYVRQFSGHTQINASDLRRLPMPSEKLLLAIGEAVGAPVPQEVLDGIIERTLWTTSTDTEA
jgi:adenine-specific DNA-methyltransferase